MIDPSIVNPPSVNITGPASGTKITAPTDILGSVTDASGAVSYTVRAIPTDGSPAKLIFTRLDETEAYGAVLNESIRTGLPVSFLGSGPRVPDDLEPAGKDRIIDLLLAEGRKNRAVATA